MERYARQTILPEIGRKGQERLAAGRVLIVGAGGLGSPAALYLAAAGVGTLGLVDTDRVSLSNLQRQILHGTPDLGVSKLVSAAARLRHLNPEVEVRCFDCRLGEDNAGELVDGFDLALGCVDNFAARYALNAACVQRRKPNVFGAISRFEGQASVFSHLEAPCYRCFFAEPPAAGDRLAAPAADGVIGGVAGIIGSIQATEALKLLLGAGRTLGGRLLLLDALNMRFRELAIKRDPDCPVCGRNGTGTSE